MRHALVGDRSSKLLLTAFVLAIIHHVDHVLRADHSGWPFRAEVTPFTFSLLIHPIFITALLIASLKVRFALVLLLFSFAQVAHMVLETPHDQYHTWAAGVSDFADTAGQPNMLHVSSPTLGYFAVVVSVLLSTFLFATLVSLAFDMRKGRRRGA
jgi:hypothetical protein